jgi:sugar lactone lactonase YvrE
VWLKGDKAGEAETFVDLPGWPDNIRLGSNGHFWIAVLQVTASRRLPGPSAIVPSYH